jgi:hypothetical protein
MEAHGREPYRARAPVSTAIPLSGEGRKNDFSGTPQRPEEKLKLD